MRILRLVQQYQLFVVDKKETLSQETELWTSGPRFIHSFVIYFQNIDGNTQSGFRKK